MNNKKIPKQFKKYWLALSPDERAALAKRAKTSVAYLQHISTGYKKAGLKSVVNIERATQGEITARMLRPDICR